MTTRQSASPPGWKSPSGYSNAVSANGRVLAIAGQGGAGTAPVRDLCVLLTLRYWPPATRARSGWRRLVRAGQALAGVNGSASASRETEAVLNQCRVLVESQCEVAGIAPARLDGAGLLAAVGLSAAQVRRLLLAEGAVVAAIGAAAGAGAGVAYARLMVYGLNTWWVDATATPFMRLFVTPRSMIVGFIAGMLVALWGTVRMLLALLRQK